MTGCSAIDGVLDDLVNYSRLTVQVQVGSVSRISDIKVTYDGKEYTAVGTYQVPNNTVVNISWYYNCPSWHCNGKGTVSKNVSIGAYEDITVTLDHGEIVVKTDNLFN